MSDRSDEVGAGDGPRRLDHCSTAEWNARRAELALLVRAALHSRDRAHFPGVDYGGGPSSAAIAVAIVTSSFCRQRMPVS
jgi:hypothetical protein